MVNQLDLEFIEEQLQEARTAVANIQSRMTSMKPTWAVREAQAALHLTDLALEEASASIKFIEASPARETLPTNSPQG